MLIITRHHESTWNKEGKWTGLIDVPLTPYGFQKANDMGILIKDINIDMAFASMKVRTIETLSCMLFVCERHEVPTIHAEELNERDYGDYTGKNKWEMQKLLGDEDFKKLRREWDFPVPNGETLKMVYERSIPYLQKFILPEVNKGKNVLVVTHGNTCRSFIKYIENIADKDIVNVEMPFGTIILYDVDKEGHMLKKEVRQIASEVNA